MSRRAGRGGEWPKKIRALQGARTFHVTTANALAAGGVLVHLLPEAPRPVLAGRAFQRRCLLRGSMRLGGRYKSGNAYQQSSRSHQGLHGVLLLAVRRGGLRAEHGFDRAAPLPVTVSRARPGDDQCSATARHRSRQRYLPLQHPCSATRVRTYDGGTEQRNPQPE